ncbi:MAG: short-chain dehydrogenase [Deltaproteobacteria bacterium]|nr:short-chain dehydrogenase [Deltaproteobacteria bacterium]
MENSTIRQRYGRWALVAGASEGLGAAFARSAASRGLDVILVARRATTLAEVATQMRADYAVQTREIVADLGDPNATKRIADATSALEVGMLICNAASEPQGAFLDVPLAAHLEAIDVNCRATLALAHHFGGLMAQRQRGSLVVVTSLGGLCGLPVFASYGASKAFGWNLGEALWAELAERGVDALSYVVGSTRTPNLERSGAPEEHLAAAVSPEGVAEALFEGLGRGPTRYASADVEAAAEGLFGLSREEAVRALGKANRDTFLQSEP